MQADLAVIRSRSALVDARTALVNHVRAAVKAMGQRLPKWSAATCPEKVEEDVPEMLLPAILPVLHTITELNAQIREMERWIDELATTEYPETALLTQSAHYTLGPFGPGRDPRGWGLARAERGGAAAKKKAIAAVARRLAVLLHRSWVTGEVYEPLRTQAPPTQRSDSDEAIAA